MPGDGSISYGLFTSWTTKPETISITSSSSFFPCLGLLTVLSGLLIYPPEIRKRTRIGFRIEHAFTQGYLLNPIKQACVLDLHSKRWYHWNSGFLFQRLHHSVPHPETEITVSQPSFGSKAWRLGGFHLRAGTLFE
ncbi:MAG: hypothetical protein CM15mP3_04950 [Candidatus Poseidoniales archaeon]|nr:MAG: hypothetical protein CM15mP3_04950 [Candidatus Poseidoniales archaeon]